MQSDRIDRCPFCGGVAALTSNYSLKKRAWFVYVKCLVCASQGRTFYHEDDPELNDWNSEACDQAIDAWNLRYQKPTE